MSTPKERKILKQNGNIVMEAIQKIDRNPTLHNLAKFISETYETDMESVKGPLKQVLESGMDLGLLKRENGQYFLSGDNTQEGEPTDAAKKRKSRKRAASSGGAAKSPKRRSKSKSKSRKGKAMAMMGDM